MEEVIRLIGAIGNIIGLIIYFVILPPNNHFFSTRIFLSYKLLLTTKQVHSAVIPNVETSTGFQVVKVL